MELNELKKIFYRTNPKAYFRTTLKGIATYESEEINEKSYLFNIPVNDMGGAIFANEMPCKYLIRWLII